METTNDVSIWLSGLALVGTAFSSLFAFLNNRSKLQYDTKMALLEFQVEDNKKDINGLGHKLTECEARHEATEKVAAAARIEAAVMAAKVKDLDAHRSQLSAELKAVKKDMDTVKTNTDPSTSSS